MKLIYQLIKYFWFILIISFGLGGNLYIENQFDSTWNVIYDSSPLELIASFQFDVDGYDVTIYSAYGGEAEAAGFIIDYSSPSVTGEVGLSGATIPAPMIGGTLVVLELSGSPTGLSNMEFSDSDGNAMVFTFIWEGCPDDSACNYDENATIDNGNGSCLYPCSTPDGCGEMDSNFDCSGNCIVGLDCVGECGGSVMDDDSCTGCMDDGYQQWSPNPGSPACYYEDFFTIRGDCLYNDCAGNCPSDDGYELIELDECGVCGGTCVDSETCVYCDGTNDDNCNTCADCAGVPNGLAYKNPFCDDDGCVGGDTGNADCLIIEIESDVLFESNSVDNTIQVFVTNLDTLRSLDIEFQYDSSVLQIQPRPDDDDVETPGFSLNGTSLESYYEISYENFVVSENLMKTIFTLYFFPNTADDSVMFFTDVEEHIFNIQVDIMDIATNTTTPIIINSLSVNEHLLDNNNWTGGNVQVIIPEGCMDDTACNYNKFAGVDDGCGNASGTCCFYEKDCLDDCGGDAELDVCGECDGNEDNILNCECLGVDGEDILFDCNGDCPPTGGCPNEFPFTKGCAIMDDCNVCVGGLTERTSSCVQDCIEEWGGSAYYDACGICIVTINNWELALATGFTNIDTTDCFSASFKIYNFNGIEINDLIVKELDTIYVVLHMQNLPNSLEGIILNIDYNSNDLFLNNWSLGPEEFNLEGELAGELNNSNELFIGIDSTFIESTIFTAAIYIANEPYQGNGGNILFLEFSNLGIHGDSTVISYNKVQVNEHVMQKQNYTSQVIYISDCIGVDTPPDDCGICGGGNADMDECGVCFGPGSIYECGCNNIPEGACDCEGNTIPEGFCDCEGNTIPEGFCDCGGNTPADLFGGEGYNCDGVLLLNGSLIPQSFALNQNYPNPFNPITYIQYSVPQFEFITIKLININGQKIKTIVNRSLQPGNYEISWDGTNHSGISVPSGIYFYKMNASNFISVRKLVLLK